MNILEALAPDECTAKNQTRRFVSMWHVSLLRQRRGKVGTMSTAKRHQFNADLVGWRGDCALLEFNPPIAEKGGETFHKHAVYSVADKLEKDPDHPGELRKVGSKTAGLFASDAAGEAKMDGVFGLGLVEIKSWTTGLDVPHDLEDALHQLGYQLEQEPAQAKG